MCKTRIDLQHQETVRDGGDRKEGGGGQLTPPHIATSDAQQELCVHTKRQKLYLRMIWDTLILDSWPPEQRETNSIL